MIQIRNLTVRYGPILALNQVSLNVREGECLLVTGPSGCGKSTLARVLNGLIPQSIAAEIEGEVVVNGMDVRKQNVPHLAQWIGVVFQNPASQLFHLRVEDEVAFGPYNLGLAGEQVDQRVKWALEAVGLEALRGCKPAELSGGQKQRLAIAAVLAMSPRVLVLDEPTASLDVSGAQQVVSTLQRLKDTGGITIVLIEHRLVEVARLADRVVVLNEGTIAADGPVADVFGDRKRLEQWGLRRPVDQPLALWSTLLEPDGHPPEGQSPLIELKGVAAKYSPVSKQQVLRDINLSIYPGEFLALVGDNGAGKSTLALVMAGLLKPSQGKVCFDRGQRPRPGRDVALLFQDPVSQLFTETVDEEVAFGPRNYGDFQQERHEQILQEADLLALKTRSPFFLSVGQQQRTALAACLALQPRFLILDEPTLGQDWGHLQRLMDYLIVLNQRGTAIMLITHDYKLVHHYARRVVWIADGSIVLDGRIRRMD